MLFQVNDRVHKRCHLKSVRSLDAAFRYVAVLNVERARGAGGEHVAGVPALDARVQGNEAGRNVRHVIDGVLRVDLAVVDALDLELEDIGHLIRCYELRSKGEERREVLDDAEVSRISCHIIISL